MRDKYASLPDISPRAKHRLRFEAEARDDMTLAQYQEHVIHACSRQDLMVMIPAHTLWRRIQEGIAELRCIRTRVEVSFILLLVSAWKNRISPVLAFASGLLGYRCY